MIKHKCIDCNYSFNIYGEHQWCAKVKTPEISSDYSNVILQRAEYYDSSMNNNGECIYFEPMIVEKKSFLERLFKF